MAKKTITLEMGKAKETKGTFRYETAADGDERPLSIYLTKTMLNEAFGAAPDNITLEIASA